jgi:hypothetical protein
MDERKFITKKDEILGRADRPVAVVEVPEWGEGAHVRVGSLTAADRDAFEADTIARRRDGRDLENIRARLAVLCIVDEQGNRVFSDDDAPALGQQSAAALGRIFAAATQLNGLSATDVEALTKN